MALNLADKKAIVSQLTDIVSGSISAAVASYRGLSVSQMNELRATARKAGVRMGVYRNTLARRAFVDTDFSCMSEALVGPMVLFFAQDEPGAAARLVRDFSKTHEQLEIRALSLDGQLLGPEQLVAVASLPSRDEALAQLLSVMKAPVTKFVRTLNEPVAQFVRVTKAVADQKSN